MSTSLQDPIRTAVLSASGLRIATTAGKEILHDVSFELQPGKILALVGESGSGKTTAGLACLGHFRAGLKHTGGEIRMNGAGPRLTSWTCRNLNAGSCGAASFPTSRRTRRCL